MAFMQMMGAFSKDYPKDALAKNLGRSLGHSYYESEGQTPLTWGGQGAERLGLVGIIEEPAYDAVFAIGGAVDPVLGTRLVEAKRPGLELVVAAHKSVAELGIIGRQRDMHQILDAETDATLAYLERLTLERGGRRGRAAVPTATSGLIYARTRHATTRSGDPGPHDHVLIANAVEMLDAKGGWKAAHTTQWRDHLHAATVVGRLHAAWQATQLGYGLRPDRGSRDGWGIGPSTASPKRCSRCIRNGRSRSRSKPNSAAMTPTGPATSPRATPEPRKRTSRGTTACRNGAKSSRTPATPAAISIR